MDARELYPSSRAGVCTIADVSSSGVLWCVAGDQPTYQPIHPSWCLSNVEARELAENHLS
jgi:hypothetical protein